MTGLGEVGPTVHHRKSFKPIADLFDAMMDGQ